MAATLEAARVSPAALPVIDIGGLWSTNAKDRDAVGAVSSEESGVLTNSHGR